LNAIAASALFENEADTITANQKAGHRDRYRARVSLPHREAHGSFNKTKPFGTLFEESRGSVNPEWGRDLPGSVSSAYPRRNSRSAGLQYIGLPFPISPPRARGCPLRELALLALAQAPKHKLLMPEPAKRRRAAA